MQGYLLGKMETEYRLLLVPLRSQEGWSNRWEKEESNSEEQETEREDEGEKGRRANVQT